MRERSPAESRAEVRRSARVAVADARRTRAQTHAVLARVGVRRAETERLLAAASARLRAGAAP